MRELSDADLGTIAGGEATLFIPTPTPEEADYNRRLHEYGEEYGY